MPEHIAAAGWTLIAIAAVTTAALIDHRERTPTMRLARTLTVRAGAWTATTARAVHARLTARRRAADQRLMEWPAILRSAMSDRGLCTFCGTEHALKKDGRLRNHDHCPGGDELPAPTLIGVDG